jgi:hypothetical protein
LGYYQYKKKRINDTVFNIKKQITIFKALVKAINKWFLKVSNGDQLIDFWFDSIAKMVLTRGIDNTIKRVKLVRLCVTRYLCNQPMAESGDVSVSLNKKGIPRLLGPLQNLIDTENISDKRLLMTLLSVSRALPGSPYRPPLNTITDESKIDSSVISELSMLIPMVMGNNSLCLNTSPKWKEFHLSTKAGPNAVALVSAMVDAHILPESLIKSIEVIGGKDLIEKLNEIRKFDLSAIAETYKIKKVLNGKPLSIRKLSIVDAPERKSRIIAILDYWSQTALKPLHDRIFSTLKTLDSDCTFRQTEPNKFLTNGPYYSLDLTAATDRFPVQVQEMILAAYTGSENYAKHWTNILTGYEFNVPWLDNCNVLYKAGQPMGAYSSWAVFTLSHHVMVRIAAMKVGNPYFTNYALLGDDIVIGDANVAREYLAIMKSLGVDISESKSHTSDRMFEFAKRWYLDKIEITGAQINAFIASKKWFLVVNEYKNLCIKWGFNDFEAEPGAIEDIFRAVGMPSGMIPRLVSKALSFLTLPWDRKGISKDDQILRFVQLTAPQVLGCYIDAKGRASDFLMTALAEVKARVIESGLLKMRGNAESFLKRSRGLLQHYKGGDAQSAIKSIPAVMVAAKQFSALANTIDDLRDPLVTTPENLIFDKVTYLGFDAERIMVTRSSEVLMATNATLVNQYKQWSIKYFSLTEEILSDEALDENTARAYSRILFRTKVIGSVMPGFPL